MAADHLVWFEHTNDETALYAAQREVSGALLVWLQLVKLTDGLYPGEMAFGPEDVGHWKDKLAYPQNDVQTLKERVELWKKYGRADYGFDFGGPVKDARENSYRQNRSVEQSNVLAGFAAVSPETVLMSSEATGGYKPGSDGQRPAAGAVRGGAGCCPRSQESTRESALGDSIEGRADRSFGSK